MRRVQIYLDEAVDDMLAVEAAGRRTSKAALIRDCIAAQMTPARSDDPADAELLGWIERELPDAGMIDDVVYGG